MFCRYFHASLCIWKLLRFGTVFLMFWTVLKGSKSSKREVSLKGFGGCLGVWKGARQIFGIVMIPFQPEINGGGFTNNWSMPLNFISRLSSKALSARACLQSRWCHGWPGKEWISVIMDRVWKLYFWLPKRRPFCCLNKHNLASCAHPFIHFLKPKSLDVRFQNLWDLHPGCWIQAWPRW